ncbi:hypothetical protein [Plantactinospora veratri]
MTDDRWIAPTRAANPSVPDELLIAMAATNDRKLQLDLITRRRYSPMSLPVATVLAGSPHPPVRRELAVARNPDLCSDLVGLLARDPDRNVTAVLLNRGHLPIEFVDGIDDSRDRQTRTDPIEWLRKRRDDAELLDRYSRARHVRYRRTVAGIPGLAPETVRRLAADEDFGVRLLLAENNPELAPVELLVEMVRSWSGRSAAAMIRDPRFPQDVIDELVRSEDSSHRWVAYRSGRLTEAQMALLADDPDPALATEVNPPAPPSRAEFVARLADPGPVPADHAPHPGHPTVREEAARHPRLPVDLMWNLWRRV